MARQGSEKAAVVLLPLTQRGLKVAERLAKGLGGAQVLCPEKLKGGGLGRKVSEAFRDGLPLVFICAVGIAVRTVAPLLRGKHLDPAVVVVDERGRWAISVLSGHLGGANALAGRAASVLGAEPVITTATDLWGLPCAEELAASLCLAVEDTGKIKAVNAAILDGRRVRVIDEVGARRLRLRQEFGDKAFRYGRAFPASLAPGEAVVLITSRKVRLARAAAARTLVLRPREIVAGIGCGRGVSKASIRKALDRALEKGGLSALSLKAIATIDIKRGEKGLVSLARELGVPMSCFDSARLSSAAGRASRSSFVEQTTGAPAVAEPAALALSGARELCVKKMRSGRVTVALALEPFRS